MSERVYRVRAVFEVLVRAEDAKEAKDAARSVLHLFGVKSEWAGAEDWLRELSVTRLNPDNVKPEELKEIPVQPWTGQHQPRVRELLGIRRGGAQ